MPSNLPPGVTQSMIDEHFDGDSGPEFTGPVELRLCYGCDKMKFCRMDAESEDYFCDACQESLQEQADAQASMTRHDWDALTNCEEI